MSDCKKSTKQRRMIHIIQQTLIALMKERPAEEITVKELCEAAEINRTTFYRYYRDIYALIDELSDNLVEELFNRVIKDALFGQKSTYACVFDVMKKIETDMNMYQILICYQPNSTFADRLQKCLLDFNYNDKEYQTSFQKEDSVLPLQFNYMAYGLFGLLKCWIASGCKASKESVSQLVEANIENIYQPLIKYRETY